MLKLSYHHGRKKGRRACAVLCRDELCFLGGGGVCLDYTIWRFTPYENQQ